MQVVEYVLEPYGMVGIQASVDLLYVST